jgi:hypothetical protein
MISGDVNGSPSFREHLFRMTRPNPSAQEDEISELLDQVDEEIREASYDLAGGFPNGALKSDLVALLKLANALALAYHRRPATGERHDTAAWQSLLRQSADLVRLWIVEKAPEGTASSAYLAPLVEAYLSYIYRGRVLAPVEAQSTHTAIEEIAALVARHPETTFAASQALAAEARPLRRVTANIMAGATL